MHSKPSALQAPAEQQMRQRRWHARSVTCRTLLLAAAALTCSLLPRSCQAHKIITPAPCNSTALHLLVTSYAAVLSRPLNRAVGLSPIHGLEPGEQGRVAAQLVASNVSVAAASLSPDVTVVAEPSVHFWDHIGDVKNVVLPCTSDLRNVAFEYSHFLETLSTLLARVAPSAASGAASKLSKKEGLFVDPSLQANAAALDAGGMAVVEITIDEWKLAPATLPACLSAPVAVLSPASHLSLLCMLGRRDTGLRTVFPSVADAIVPLNGILRPAWLFLSCAWDGGVLQEVLHSALTVGHVQPVCVLAPGQPRTAMAGLQYVESSCAAGTDAGATGDQLACYAGLARQLSAAHAATFISAGPVLFQRRVILDSFPVLLKNRQLDSTTGAPALLEGRVVAVHAAGETFLRNASTVPINSLGHVVADGADTFHPTAAVSHLAAVSPAEVLSFFQTGECSQGNVCLKALSGSLCFYLSRHNAVSTASVYANLQRACSSLLSAYRLHTH